MKDPWHVYPDGTVEQLTGDYLEGVSTFKSKRKALALGKKIKAKLLKQKTRYIVAVRAVDGNGIFEFKTKKARSSFIKDLKLKYKGVQYATAQMS